LWNHEAVNDQAQSTPPPRRFTRRQAIGAGVAMAAGTSGWIYLKSRQAAGEPPLALLHAGDPDSRRFAFLLQSEMTKLGAREAQVYATIAAANESLKLAERGIYALVAAGPAPQNGQLAVIAEIREAAWHTTLWTQRRRVSRAALPQGAELWHTSLASTLASASRGIFSSKLRANPGAIRIYEQTMEPWRQAGALLPLSEDASPRPAWSAPELARVAKGMRDALAVDPAFPVARARLALTLVWSERWDEARKEALQALEGDERVWAANYALGLVQLRAGDPLAGCRYLGRALEVAPFHLEVVAGMPAQCPGAGALIAEVRSVLPRHTLWLNRP
jgi:tetratricopeptide (TPR) repeat protein